MSGVRDDEASDDGPTAHVAIGCGPMGALAAEAAVTLVREELAHTLSAPVAYFRMLVGELEAGRPLTAEHIEIAREEADRIQRLVASLRASPSIRVTPGPLSLVKGLRAACRDLERGSLGAGVDVVLDVPESVTLSADVTALGLVIYSVVTALVARGAARIVLSSMPPSPESTTMTLRVVSEVSGAVPPVFIARAWAGNDRDAMAFAIARRAARASGMLLRPSHDDDSVICLEIPLHPPTR
jgi:hypothetical protein